MKAQQVKKQKFFDGHEYLQSAWRCILASGSSWVSGAGPCTVLLKRLPLFRFTKAKIKEKNKVYKNPLSHSVHSTSEHNKKKMDEKIKREDSLYCCGGPLMEGSTS